MPHVVPPRGGRRQPPAPGGEGLALAVQAALRVCDGARIFSDGPLAPDLLEILPVADVFTYGGATVTQWGRVRDFDDDKFRRLHWDR